MILVTGATGQIGSALVAELATADADLRMLVRSAEEPTEDLELCFGVEPVVGDFTRPDTLDAAMAGVHKVFLNTTGGPAMVDQLGAATAAAARAGVRHVVKVSPLLPPAGVSLRSAGWHGQVDEAIRASGIDWTILRANAFMQNSLGQAAAIVGEGVLAAPLADARVSVVDARDLAEAAARVLGEDGHAGREYLLTGPEALGMADQARLLSEALERTVAYRDVSESESRAALRGAGLDDELAGAMLELWAAQRAGLGSEVSPDLERLLGGPPRTFAEFAADYRSAFERGGA